MNKLLLYLQRIWDPRPLLAKTWFESAEKYEERLRANQTLNPQIVDAVLGERNRIAQLFSNLLSEPAKNISVVITNNTQTEYCAIFQWESRLYVLVSGALLGRPYDHPNEPGFKAWEWLARHETVHIVNQHLPWFFHTRRLFRLSYLSCALSSFFLCIFAPEETWLKWRESFLWLLGATWLIQTVVALSLEWQADRKATASIQDSQILKETQESLQRMSRQARNQLIAPFGWIQYGLSLLFVDPHPPLAARLWLLRRNIRRLEKRT